MQVNFALGRWAPKTRRLYEDSWRDFCAWCATQDAAPFPAEPQTVADYLTARAETLSVSTLSIRLAAIVNVHELQQQPLKIRGSVIRDAWSEIRRTKGTAKTPKAALVIEDLKRVIAGIPAARLQDRAVLLVGFASAMRRSELVALNREDLAFSPTALTIIVRRSKTDKAGKGAPVAILRNESEFCAVAALEAWLDDAGIVAGPIFRAAPTGRRPEVCRVLDGRMQARTVAEIAKRWGEKAGLDPKTLGAHSLRRGCITSMYRGGADIRRIMDHSRHKSVEIAMGYISREQAASNPALKTLVW